MIADLGTAVTPTDLLGRVRGARATAVAAEAAIMVAAAAWADAHPVLAGRPEPHARRDAAEAGAGRHEFSFDEDRGIPVWAWDATAPFAAALGRSTASGADLIRDALVLRHRLPRVWDRVQDGTVEAWRARRIAQAVHGAPDDVCTYLDTTLADLAHRVGLATLDRLLDEAMLRLHPEERETAQLEALEHRHATLHEQSISHTGIAEMTLRGDWADLAALDDTLSEVAAALATTDATLGTLDPHDTLDVRRSRAIGVLADPAAALALLQDHGQGHDHDQDQDQLRPRPRPTPRRRTTLVVHLSTDALAGLDPVGGCETLRAPVLEATIRSWCARTDAHLTVLPVLDLTQALRTDAYQAPDRLRRHSTLLHGTCVFPWCTRPAARCDLDHRTPARATSDAHGGETSTENLAPLCRHHHRLKTQAGWSDTGIDPGTYLWTDPYRQQFLRDPTGTLDVTPGERSRRPPDAPRGSAP